MATRPSTSSFIAPAVDVKDWGHTSQFSRPYRVCVIAFLSPLRGLLISHLPPTACAPSAGSPEAKRVTRLVSVTTDGMRNTVHGSGQAVGCILSPLRGWYCVVSSTFPDPIELRHRLLPDGVWSFNNGPGVETPGYFREAPPALALRGAGTAGSSAVRLAALGGTGEGARPHMSNRSHIQLACPHLPLRLLGFALQGAL